MNGYGAPMMYGVPSAVWLSWDSHTQQLWLQDYYRTPAQTTYYQDQTFLYDVAYTYTGLVDVATGLDASEVGANVNATVEDVKEAATNVAEGLTEVVQTGAQITTLALIVGGLYLLGDR